MTEAAPVNRYGSSIPRQEGHQIYKMARLADDASATDLRVVEPMPGRQRTGVGIVGGGDEHEVNVRIGEDEIGVGADAIESESTLNLERRDPLRRHDRP